MRQTSMDDRSTFASCRLSFSLVVGAIFGFGSKAIIMVASGKKRKASSQVRDLSIWIET